MAQEQKGILTAEEFIKQETVPFGEWTMEELKDLLIRFAKFHCVEQKNAILANCEYLRQVVGAPSGNYIMDTEIEKIKYYKNII